MGEKLPGTATYWNFEPLMTRMSQGATKKKIALEAEKLSNRLLELSDTYKSFLLPYVVTAQLSQTQRYNRENHLCALDSC